MTTICPYKRKIKKLESNAEADIDSVLIAQDIQYPGRKTISKCYAVHSLDKVKELIKTNQQLYELVQEKTPVALYFDIEWYDDGKPRIEEITDTIAKEIKVLVGDVDMTSYMLTASRQEKEKYKHSYHIHYPGIVFRNINILHSFMYKLLERMYSNPENKDFLFSEREPVIDCCVYNKWRAFRLPGQSGLGKNCPMTSTTDEHFNIHNYLINKSEHTVAFDEVPGCKLSKQTLRAFGKSVPKHDDESADVKEPMGTIGDVKEPMGTTCRSRPLPIPTNPERTLGLYKLLQSAHPDREEAIPLSAIAPESTYYVWMQCAYILKNSGAPFELFHLWSAQSTTNYEGLEDCQKCWKSVSKGKPTIASLFYIANKSNPSACGEMTKIREYESFPVVDFECPTTRYTERYLGKIESDSRKVFISANLGCGKSHQIKEFIKENPDLTYAVISPRITYSEAVYGDLADCGFETYRDKYVELSTRKRVICSIESLHRLEDSKYDVLILDEIETILASITSETNYREYDANMKVWENLVKKAKKFFIADAYLTHRTTDFFSRIPGESHAMVHDWTYRPKTMLRYEDPRDFLEKFKELALAGKRIYMVCLSKKQMLSTFAPFLKENGISHLIYHQQSGDKRKRELQNVDEVWTSVQVVLTTPTITIGINQSKTVHFDHRFIYTGSHSCTPRDTFQAMWRVRETTTSVDHWYSDKRTNTVGNKGEPLTHAALTEFLIKKRWDNLPNRIVSEPHIRHLAIWNRLEENISNVAFQKWFQAIIEERLNYSIQVVKNSNEDAINSIKVEHVEYDDIPVLTDDEAMRIKLAQQIGAEEETPQMDIIALRKYRFIEALLGNDGLPTTTDFKPSADLWKHCKQGYNLLPIKFTKWVIEGLPEALLNPKRDIFYRDTVNQFEVMQALKKFLPDTRGEMMTEDQLTGLTDYLTKNAESLRALARIGTRKADLKTPIKTLNAILERFSLLTVKSSRQRVNGKRERVYTVVSEFEDTLAFIEETTAPPADLESALFGNPEEVPWKYE